MSDPIRDEWRSDDGSVRLILGDCLEVLPTLEAGSVDAVVTDPPYIVGAISTGVENAKCGTWADMQNAAYWFAAWFDASRRVLRRSGHLATCGNWRSMPTLLCAFARISWPVTSCIIWDKQRIGPGYKNAFRPMFELAVHAAMPEGEVLDRSVGDVFRGEQWMAGQNRTTPHPAEKPVDFMQYLTDNLTEPSAVIVDPFMGSGTTGVACIRTGRRFIGIELEQKYFEIAKRRCRDELNRFPLIEPKRPRQRELMEVEASGR